jgi:hypothetical protein
MSTNKIKIDHVTGGRNRDELKNCYFEASNIVPGGYDFFDKNGVELASGLLPGEPFEFGLDGHEWVIYDWTADTHHADGSWRNDAPPEPELEQGGTFTAQAGGGVEDELDQGRRILPLEQIVIDKVLEDGQPIDSPLLNCFFAPEGPEGAGEYLFFGHRGEKLHGKITDGLTFKVTVEEQEWEMTAHFHPHQGKAHGTWKPAGDGEADGGTYTAQAGGGLATAASAY